MDGRAKWINMYAFVDLPGLVWPGPQLEAYQGLELAVQPFNTLRPSENCSEESEFFDIKQLSFFHSNANSYFPW